MGKEIPDENGGGDFNPTAFLKEANATLKGTLVEKREYKSQWGLKPVYVFKVLDATCRFFKDKQEVQPDEGSLADVLPPTRLARQLAHVSIGQTVTMEYAGQKKVGRGNPAHIFKVTVDQEEK